MAGKSSKRSLNPFEALGSLDNVLGGIPGAFVDSIKGESKQTLKTAAQQVVGHAINSSERSHEKPTKSGPVKMEAGKAIQLGKKESSSHERPSAEKKLHIRAAIDYHGEMARLGERSVNRESRENEQKYQQILDELQRLVKSASMVIQNEYKDVVVATAPKSPGKYHTNFLDWMLSVIRSARQKVEDSGAWLAATRSKRGGKGYKARAKNEGTKFTQNMDRNVATSTG